MLTTKYYQIKNVGGRHSRRGVTFREREKKVRQQSKKEEVGLATPLKGHCRRQRNKSLFQQRG